MKQLRVQRPCSLDWEELRGDGEARFCSSCDTVVHNLDAMSQEEITTLLRDNPNGFCATYVRPEGEAFVIREPKGRAPTKASAITIAATVLASALAACDPGTKEPPTTTTAISAPEAAPLEAGDPGTEAHRTVDEEELSHPATNATRLTDEQMRVLRSLGYVAN